MPLPDWLARPPATALGALKAALFVACLAPALLLGWHFYADELGANPIEAITRSTGDWTLRFVLIGLAITPVRQALHLPWLIRLRRMLGLYAFFYASLHLLIYLWLDRFFDWPGILRDIARRPFVTVGFAAFVLLLPLALTSFNAAIRALGGKRWQALHRSVYAIGILSVIHYWWLVKRDIREPLVYAVILAALLSARAWRRELERRRQLAPRAPATPPRPPLGDKH